jgi:hypothetical protein
MKKLIILACITVLLGTVGATYAATSQDGQASETGGSVGGVPHPPEGQSEGPPPATQYSAPPASASMLSDSAIAAVARSEAEKAGDEQPTISAVNTTLQRAIETDPAGKAPVNPATEAMMKSKVVLVTMYGHFQLTRAHLPMGDQKVPTGTVFTLAIDAYTGWVDYREISEQPASGIVALGAARELP